MTPQVTLKQCIFVIQPIYNEASHRPLVSNYNSALANDLYESTNQGNTITRETVSNVASNIIMPSTASGGVRDIVGGWNERRLAGYLLFEISTPAETKMEVLTVYTDRFDVSHMGTLAPDTVFNIDSRKVISSSLQTGVINQHTGGATRDYMLLKPVDVVAHGDVQTKSFLSRPADVMGAMQKIDIGEAFTDTRCRASRSGSDANSLDSDSATFVSKTLNSYKLSAANNQHDDMGYGIEGVVYDGAMQTLKAEHSQESAAITLFKKQTEFVDSGFFSWGDLIYLFDHNNDNLSSISRTIGTTVGSIEDTRNESQQWHGSDKFTNLAFRINDKLGKEMANRLLMNASFIVKQDSVGRPDVQVYDVGAMFDGMSEHHILKAVEDLRNIISIELVNVINNYADSYYMDIKATAFVNNRFDISLDGSNIETFIAPSFCTSLTSSMVADSEDSLVDLAAGLKGIIDNTFNNSNTPVINSSGLDFGYNTPASEPAVIATPSSYQSHNIGRRDSQSQSPAQPERKVISPSGGVMDSFNF